MNPVPRAVVVCLSLAVLAAPAWAAGEDVDHPFEHVVQFRGAVVVGSDGNGALAAPFPTTVEGEAVHYVLIVENGCDPGAATISCPPPVSSIRIILDDDVVFQTDAPFARERVPVALNDVGGGPNQLVVAAAGTPGAAARVAILAVRPLPIVVGGRSVLPLATTLGNLSAMLFVHNAGPADLVYRIEVFHADGRSAGLTAPRLLSSHATASADVTAIAAVLDPTWIRGPVHVRWAARGFTRVSTTAREFRRAPDAGGILQVAGVEELALDDYRPRPLRPSEASPFGFCDAAPEGARGGAPSFRRGVISVTV